MRYSSSMVAHLDSVTSLAVDQHGLYLISGSHDCSIRWLKQEKTTFWFEQFVAPPSPLASSSYIGKSQAVEPWEQDMCPRDHSSQEKVWREHFRCCFPSFETIHCQVLSIPFCPLKNCLNFVSLSAGADALAKVFIWRPTRPSSEDHQNIYYMTLYRFKIIFR